MVANLFKKYEFSEDFISMVRDEAKKHLLKNGANLNSERQALVNQKKGMELKKKYVRKLNS